LPCLPCLSMRSTTNSKANCSRYCDRRGRWGRKNPNPPRRRPPQAPPRPAAKYRFRQRRLAPIWEPLDLAEEARFARAPEGEAPTPLWRRWCIHAGLCRCRFSRQGRGHVAKSLSVCRQRNAIFTSRKVSPGCRPRDASA
jgi:hypothetical protein